MKITNNNNNKLIITDNSKTIEVNITDLIYTIDLSDGYCDPEIEELSVNDLLWYDGFHVIDLIKESPIKSYTISKTALDILITIKQKFIDKLTDNESQTNLEYKCYLSFYFFDKDNEIIDHNDLEISCKDIS